MASQPTNPWRPGPMQFFAAIVRLTIWFTLVLNLLMAAVWSVWFVAQLLWNLHRYLSRTLFGEAW